MVQGFPVNRLAKIEQEGVVGPFSSTDNAIARFDGTTGKVIQDYTSNAPTIGDTGVSTFRGNVLFGTDNTYDMGAAGATRPRTLYLGTKVVVGDSIDTTNSSTGLFLRMGGTAYWVLATTGNFNPQTHNQVDIGSNGVRVRNIYSGYFESSAGNALTAAGTNRATALQLANQINNVTTVASGTGVILPVGAIGMRITIFNNGANSLQVYGSASETIDGVAGSTGVPLTNPNACEYFYVATNTWISAQLGGISA